MKFSPETIEKASTLTSAAWPEKTRVYTLAKNLGFSSREMIDLLAVLQISKRAQSNVSPDEITSVLDYIAATGDKKPSPEQSSDKQPSTEQSSDKQPNDKKAGTKQTKAATTTKAAKTSKAEENNTAEKAKEKADKPKAKKGSKADKTTEGAKASELDKANKAPKKSTKVSDDKLADEKLRHRVRKNVENEINQIAQKVDAEITAVVTDENNATAEENNVKAEGTPAATSSKASSKAAVEATETLADARASETYAPDAPVEAPARPAAKAPARLFAEAPAPDVPAAAKPAMSANVPVFRAPDVPSELTTSDIDEIVAFTEQAEDATGKTTVTDSRPDSRGGVRGGAATTSGAETEAPADEDSRNDNTNNDNGNNDNTNSRGRRRRGRRGGSRGRGNAENAGTQQSHDDDHATTKDESTKHSKGGESTGAVSEKPAREDKNSKHESVEKIDEPRGLRGSSRLEAQRRRRNELREETRKTERIVSASEFQERRDAITRKMVVCERPRMDGPGTVTQLGLLEDDVLVEHFVNADNQGSIIGNIYLGRVENVLRNMEAAFIDIGQGRNAVLYAGEVDWKARGLHGSQRRIEAALKPGDRVLVQVIKDPLGHKGARLTAHISFSGRYLVYVPGGHNAGISRKLPAPERSRLKEMLERVVPEDGGTIIRTAAEGVPERAIAADVDRMHNQWLHIQQRVEEEKELKSTTPVTLFEEPDMLVKVVRDLFNEDYSELIVDGDRAYSVIYSYVKSIAPDLLKRITKHDASKFDGQDSFTAYHIDEQIESALSRHVPLPSGGSLVIDRTEAMIVIDVNTGKFTGKRKGGNLEETVTRNNLEAVDEIVRQIRLRDLGGMIVMDFIDMVLEENQDLVLRRLKERLTQDRSRYQVSEVTSLGLVQMTRKRIGTGLLEAYGMECPTCAGRGVVINSDPVDAREQAEVAAKTHHQEPENGYGRDRVSTTSEEALDDGDQQETEQAQEQAGRRQRGGRRADRAERAERKRQRASAAEFESLAASVIGKAQPEPEQAEAANAQASPDDAAAESGRGSYEQAVAEFEASPRRRRRTRGNSRSDHRPRREDFHSDDHASHEGARGAALESAAEKTAAHAGEQGSAKSDGKTAVRKSTKRRRVVRRLSNARDTAAEQHNGEQHSGEQSGAQSGESGAQSVDKKRRGAEANGVVRKSTRRRRVVRKLVKK